MCIGQGALRVCTVCVQVAPGTSTLRCTRCTQSRHQGYFSTGSDVCRACHLQEKYFFAACSAVQVSLAID